MIYRVYYEGKQIMKLLGEIIIKSSSGVPLSSHISWDLY